MSELSKKEVDSMPSSFGGFSDVLCGEVEQHAR